MTKTDFIERMALKANINKTQAKKITHLFLDTLYECLKESGRVKFYGFGIFEVKTTKKKIGRNPKTKEECVIPERKTIKFKTSEKIIEEMNE